MTVFRAAMIPMLVALSACASEGGRVGKEAHSIVMQPLNDINVMQDDIPANLVAIEKTPYTTPGDCVAIASEIDGLDAVLGPDLDTVPLTEEAPIVSTSTAERAATSAIRDAALGWIPFRGVIRTVSGADRRAREVDKAILAGTVRRAYLKGYRAHLGCVLAPMPLGPGAQSG